MTTSSRRGLARGGALLALAALAACEQPDDVVAQLSALRDAGMAGSTAPPPPPPPSSADECVTSTLHVTLSAIVRDGCRVPTSASTLTALGAFFLSRPPPQQSAEERPIAACDIFRGFWLYEAAPQQYSLCPAYCELATDYVREQDALFLACQGASGS